MNISTKKGITLVELLITLLIIGIVSPLITILFSYGYESFSTHTKNAAQQEKIQRAFRLLEKDLSECSKISYKYSTNPILEYIQLEFATGAAVNIKRWSITGSALQCSFGAASSTAMSVDGIENSTRSFIAINQANKTVLVSVVPEETIKGKFEGNNIREPITTEYSVKYKYFEQIAP